MNGEFWHSTVEYRASIPPAFQRSSEILGSRLKMPLGRAVSSLQATRVPDLPQPVVTALTRCRHRCDQKPLHGRPAQPRAGRWSAARLLRKMGNVRWHRGYLRQGQAGSAAHTVEPPGETGRHLPGSMLAEHRARGVECLAVNLEGVPGLARQPWARLEQVPHDVRRDDHDRGVLQRDGPHVRGLMAVHPRLPAELAGMNRRDLAHLTIPDHLERDGT